MKISYSWSWSRLGLWRTKVDGDGIGGAYRIFTLWPRWVWHIMLARFWYPPDPFHLCEVWLKRNRHWDDDNFRRAICWYYANRSEPRALVRLNPTILK